MVRVGTWLGVAGLALVLSAGGLLADRRLHIAPSPVTASEIAAALTAGATPATSAPGVIGAQVQDVPAGWPVRGCEIVKVNPGGTAQSLGLVGASQRADPVGDVIATIQDATAGGASQPVASCAALAAALSRMQSGDTITVGYFHRAVGVLGGSWRAGTASAILAGTGALACPPPLVGTFTSSSAGNRIQIEIDIRGPTSAATYPAVLDTGAVETIVPDEYLRVLGFQPSSTTATAGLVPGTQTTAYVYRVPGSAILVEDQGRFVPLASGNIVVWGIPDENGIWLGPNVLEHGLKLTTAGRAWTLNVPCSTAPNPDLLR